MKRNLRIKEAYVTGSNALKYDHASLSDQNNSLSQKGKKKFTSVKSKVRRVYTLVLISLVLLMALVCIMILKTQFTVANTSIQAIDLNHELTAIRRENDHLESTIHEQLDLVEIKRIAMEEYGMVFPSSEETVKISPKTSSYTVQYAAIKDREVQRISIGNVLAFITKGW